MKGLDEFLKEGGVYMGGRSVTYDNDKEIVYADLTPAEKKELDSYCLDNYSKRFIDCTWEEQSTARSTIWAEKNDPDEIEDQNKKDEEM